MNDILPRWLLVRSGGEISSGGRHSRIVSFQPADDRIWWLQVPFRRPERLPTALERSLTMRATPARNRSSPPSSLNFRTRCLRIDANAGARPGQAFQENRTEQHAERSPIHVVLLCAAVKHHRAEQHFDKQRIVDGFGKNFAGRRRSRWRSKLIVIEQAIQQRLIFVALVRKCLRDL